jgi:hypothetical protein
LVVEVGRGAVEDAGGFSGAVEEEHGGHGGDVAEGLSGGRIGDSPAEIRAERGDNRANLSFGRLDGESDDDEVVAMPLLEFAKPFESGATWRAPSGPEFDEDYAIGELIVGQRAAGEVSYLEGWKCGDFASRRGSVGVLGGDDVFLAGENQIDHAGQVGLEFGLIGIVAPGGIAAGAFDFAEIAEFTGRGDEDVVHEDSRITFDTEAFGKLRCAEIFANECEATGVLCGDFLYQQTCRVGDVSSVGPAHEGELDGFGIGQRKSGGGLLRG